ncbi:MAG: glycine--tRNA ligase subunit beta [Syntrophomonadaceae bacterium]|nr:glycine--tRNA ligase subunit beta [Syntrophomonadaceae bacterium]
MISQARLGTVWTKTQRLRGIAEFVGKELGFTEMKLIDRAALLCKADLETSMVGEFPELQGIMGRHYAIIDGEDHLVAQAISEHYQPRFAGDQIPVSHAGIAVSLAEKFDNLVGNFAIGVKPSGSQDPFALRRQALGIVAIVLEGKLTLNLDEVIGYTYRKFEADLDLSEDQVVDGVLDFIMQRLRGVLSESGFTYDVLDAVLSNCGPDLLLIQDKARALTSLKEQPYFDDLMVVFNRPFNLSRQAGDLQVQPEFFVDQVEQVYMMDY